MMLWLTRIDQSEPVVVAPYGAVGFVRDYRRLNVVGESVRELCKLDPGS